MSDRAARKLDFILRLLLCMAHHGHECTSIHVRAQAKAENPTQNIADTWQGTLHAGRDLRTVVKISKADDGGYKAVFYSIDQGGDGIPVTKITLEGTTVKMSLTMIGGTYEGKLSSDGKTITGTWSQGPNPLPLNLTRATPETEWTIPPAEPKLPPMDANAHPSFEVATIKPSTPDKPRQGIWFQGTAFQNHEYQSLNDLIAFAYGLQAKQIIEPPPWSAPIFTTSRPSPTRKGTPSMKQMQVMVQKLHSGSLQADLSSRQEGAFRLCDLRRQRRTEDDQEHSRAEWPSGLRFRGPWGSDGEQPATWRILPPGCSKPSWTGRSWIKPDSQTDTISR